MKVLWVTPYVPDPIGGGGATHEFELLRLGARHHEIEVISSEMPDQTIDLDLGERTVPMSGVPHWVPRDGARRRVHFASQFLQSWPSHELWLLRDRLPALRTAIGGHQQRRAVDLVHFTSTELAGLVGASAAPTAVLVFDVFSRHAQRERAIAVSPERRLRWAVEARRTAYFERRWLSRFDAVAALTDVDADALRRLTSKPVTVVPTPIPESFFADSLEPRSSRAVAFIANLAYRPNVDAVEWLATEIWPRLLTAVPDAELYVVGTSPDPDVRKAVARVGGALHPNVPDVRPYYWRAAASVAPVRLGSGLRNKILHAAACGAPIVSTAIALEGIGLQPDQDALVANDAAAFADAIASTLLEPGDAVRRARHARAFVERYRPDAVGKAFDDWWVAASSPRLPSR
jgi:glycosyltransferase involved in cell wall biosynthesis